MWLSNYDELIKKIKSSNQNKDKEELQKKYEEALKSEQFESAIEIAKKLGDNLIITELARILCGKQTIHSNVIIDLLQHVPTNSIGYKYAQLNIYRLMSSAKLGDGTTSEYIQQVIKFELALKLESTLEQPNQNFIDALFNQLCGGETTFKNIKPNADTLITLATHIRNLHQKIELSKSGYKPGFFKDISNPSDAQIQAFRSVLDTSNLLQTDHYFNELCGIKPKILDHSDDLCFMDHTYPLFNNISNNAETLVMIAYRINQFQNQLEKTPDSDEVRITLDFT